MKGTVKAKLTAKNQTFHQKPTGTHKSFLQKGEISLQNMTNTAATASEEAPVPKPHSGHAAPDSRDSQRTPSCLPSGRVDERGISGEALCCTGVKAAGHPTAHGQHQRSNTRYLPLAAGLSYTVLTAKLWHRREIVQPVSCVNTS